MRRQFNDLSLRRKLIILLCVVGFVPVTLLSVFISVSSYHTMVKSKQTDMESALELACASVNSQVSVCEQMMQYFVYDQNLIEFLECSPEQKTERYGYYQELKNSIFALQYQNLALRSVTIYSEGISTSLGEETQPLALFERELFFGEDVDEERWYFDEETMEMVHMYKIPSYSGLESYAVARVNMNSMFQSLSQLAAGSYGVSVRCGEELLRSSGAETSGEASGAVESEQSKSGEAPQSGTVGSEQSESGETPQSGTVETMQSASGIEIWSAAGAECVDEEGEPLSYADAGDSCIQVQKEIESLGVTAICFQPKSSIQFISWNAFIGVVMIIAICLAVILLLGRAVADYISKPLEMLTEEIQTVNQDRIGTQLSIERKDEAGILIRSYNHMMQQIQELIQENYETRIAQKEFEMKALQAQINPHFLYNSLSIINWKAIESGEEEISRITLALSTFYRSTLNKGNTMMSIRMALENIQAYLKLQLWMHDDDFRVNYEIDEGTFDYMIPALIFQPFVENSLEHGLDVKEDPDHQLWICIRQDEELIYVEIRDNGVGMDEKTLEHILEYQAQGYGVKNVNDRMTLHYGQEYGIRIESRPGRGTDVLLKFPKKQEK